MDRRLYEASLSGSVADLENLEGEDPLILDRVSLTCFDQTPLHIAAWRGHSDFTRALLSRKPRLASELNSARCSPLHLASAEGHREIVQHLLDVNDDVCEVHDEDGRTPLHLAAMKGRVEVIELLTRARPESIRQKLGRGGETVLHMCVKYNRLEALKTLVDEFQNDAGFVNSEDQDGNTILHLAAALQQLDIEKLIKELPSMLADLSNGDLNSAEKDHLSNGISFQHTENGTNPREAQSMLLERIASEMNQLKFYITHAQEELHPYFSLPVVIDGFFNLSKMLFDIASGGMDGHRCWLELYFV